MSPANNFSHFLGISKSPTSASSSAGGLHKTFTGMTNPFATDMKKNRGAQYAPLRNQQETEYTV